MSISKGISRPETISFRSSFLCPETISFGLIPKLQVSASLKLIGPSGTARPGHLKSIVSGTLPKLIVSVDNKLLLKLLVSGGLCHLLILIISETFLGAPKPHSFQSVCSRRWTARLVSSMVVRAARPILTAADRASITEKQSNNTQCMTELTEGGL
jgi:hypothetical protein